MIRRITTGSSSRTEMRPDRGSRLVANARASLIGVTLVATVLPLFGKYKLGELIAASGIRIKHVEAGTTRCQ